MKKMSFPLLLVFLIPLLAEAYGIRTNVSGTREEAIARSATRQTAKAVSTSSINDWLKKQNCQCNEKNQMVCKQGDFNYVAKKMQDWRAGLESTVSNDFNFYVHATSYECAKYARNILRSQIGYWDYYVYQADSIKLWVKQH